MLSSFLYLFAFRALEVQFAAAASALTNEEVGSSL